MKSTPTNAKTAFTLIELLVVIAIIALLVGILLPALAAARETARTTKCMVNFKSIGQAFSLYANDNKERIWEAGYTGPGVGGQVFRFWYGGSPDTTRPANNVTNPLGLGPAFIYLSYVDRVFECPSNKRKSPTAVGGNSTDPAIQAQLALWNEFLNGTDRKLNFDYTMVTGSSGARLSSQTLCGWTRNLTGGPTPANIERFKSIPIYFEEDTRWYNSISPDGLFSNLDQVSRRHSKSGHAVLLDCSVEAFTFPAGPNPDAEDGDWTANAMYCSRRGTVGTWFQLAPSWPGPPGRAYGWTDHPRAQ